MGPDIVANSWPKKTQPVCIFVNVSFLWEMLSRPLKCLSQVAILTFQLKIEDFKSSLLGPAGSELVTF